VFFGRYRHVLVRRQGELFIQRKLTILLNDYLPGRIDFYSI
jgi:3-phenylpropionate/cinnamic acid dioxygenase small subunit